MKVVGIDPSSSRGGVALVDHNPVPDLLWTLVWEKDKNKSAPSNILSYFNWLTCVLSSGKPGLKIEGLRVAELACVEFLGVERNAQTTRLVSHYQAISVLAAKRAGLVVVEARVSSARKEALGRGDLSKDDAWVLVKKMFPDHQFLVKNRGGEDEADAVVLAVAGPGIAEGA